jgi:Ca2+-binding RTX toxin-like protein
VYTYKHNYFKEVTMAVTREQVAELYVAFFERAPDADGLAYWVNDSGLTIDQISDSFFDQPETQEKYPETMDNATYIETIYQNLFDRSADTAGAIYWASELDSGNISRADMIMAVVNGAQDTETSKDDTILANKTAVGLDFADNGLNDLEQSKEVMAGVDATEESVTAAKAKTDEYAAETFKYQLTSGVDAIEGSAQDDLIKGVMSDTVGTATFTASDVIDGGEGNDTLSFAINGTTGTVGNVKTTIDNVETVELRGATSAGTTIATKEWTSVEKYIINKQASALTLKDVKDTFNAVDLVGATADSTLTVTLADGLADSTIAVKVASTAKKNTLDISDNSVEHYKLTSTGNSAGATFITAATNNNDSKLSSITVDGDSDIILDTTTGATSLEKIDASALKAALNTNSSTNLKASNNDIIVLGGEKNNLITLADGDNKITTFAGNDIINLGKGNNTVVAGDGTNSVTIADGNSTVTTGSGDDKIAVSGATLGGAIGIKTGNNTIIAGDGVNYISAGAGADDITTGAGNDTILSGAGNDTIVAGNGTNIITATAGNNTITGGTGTDTISVAGGIQVVDSGTGTNTLDITGDATKVTLKGSYSDINVNGTTTLDTSAISSTLNLDINTTGKTVTLAAGTFGTIDAATSGIAAATLVASAITSDITYKGATGVDTVTTGSGSDTISGNAGADVINAGAGVDTITGGTGADKLTGGTGVDTFKFVSTGTTTATMDTIATAAGAGADTIKDFVSGSDKLSFGLAATDANLLINNPVGDSVAVTNFDTAFDQGVIDINTAYTATAGTYYFFATDGTDGYLFLDNATIGNATTGADGVLDANDTAIILTGVTSLAEIDIIA